MRRTACEHKQVLHAVRMSQACVERIEDDATGVEEPARRDPREASTTERVHDRH